MVFALGAGVVGGAVTSSLADEARVEVGIGELRGAILSLFAPAGAVSTETNPNYRGAAAPAPLRGEKSLRCEPRLGLRAGASSGSC